jgi:hypothetical protein
VWAGGGLRAAAIVDHESSLFWRCDQLETTAVLARAECNAHSILVANTDLVAVAGLARQKAASEKDRGGEDRGELDHFA